MHLLKRLKNTEQHHGSITWQGFCHILKFLEMFEFNAVIKNCIVSIFIYSILISEIISFSLLVFVRECNHYILDPKRCTRLFSAGVYYFEVHNRSTGKMCRICSKLNIIKPERHQWQTTPITLNVKIRHLLLSNVSRLTLTITRLLRM